MNVTVLQALIAGGTAVLVAVIGAAAGRHRDLANLEGRLKGFIGAEIDALRAENTRQHAAAGARVGELVVELHAVKTEQAATRADVADTKAEVIALRRDHADHLRWHMDNPHGPVSALRHDGRTSARGDSGVAP